MREIEVRVPEGTVLPTPVRIERAAIECGLSVTMRGALEKYPGCKHWHLKKGRERGTLEVTLWPQQRRLWLSVQNGRVASWVGAAAHQLKALLGQQR